MAGATNRQKSALKLVEAILVLVLGVVALIYQAEMSTQFDHMRKALKDEVKVNHVDYSDPRVAVMDTSDPPVQTGYTVPSPRDTYLPYNPANLQDVTWMHASLDESAHAAQYICFSQGLEDPKSYPSAETDECLASTWAKETKRMARDVDRAYHYSMAGLLLFFLPVLATAFAYTVSTVMNDSSDGADWTKPTFMNGVPLHLITMSHVLGFFIWMMILGVGLGNDYYKSEYVTTVGTHHDADYVQDTMDQQASYEHFTHNFVRVFILNAIIFAGHLTVHFSEPTDLKMLVGSVTGGMKSAKPGVQATGAARVASSLRAVTVSKMV